MPVLRADGLQVVGRRGDGAVGGAVEPRDETRRAQFSQDLADLIARFNRATDGTVAAPADYLEAVGTRT